MSLYVPANISDGFDSSPATFSRSPLAVLTRVVQLRARGVPHIPKRLADEFDIDRSYMRTIIRRARQAGFFAVRSAQNSAQW